MNVAVIGIGNGGQAIAGHLAINGHNVSLYGRNQAIVDRLNQKGGIQLEGCISGFGKINIITTDISKVIKGADVIMIVTTANGHHELASILTSYLETDQIIVLNPGRTGGAFEFRNVLMNNGFTKNVYIVEAQTLVYACRIIENGLVNIIGVKEKVFIASYPSSDRVYIEDKLHHLYNSFICVDNVLITSFENIGAVFHPSVILFNAASIERGHSFYFYRNMTSSIADFIELLDEERLQLGKSYGIDLIKVRDWISYAYSGVEGDSLQERMKSNPAYYDIHAPKSIRCRQILEDIPMGIVPLLGFGKVANVPMPLFIALLNICSSLLGIDFLKEGRTLKRMGFQDYSLNEIIKSV